MEIVFKKGDSLYKEVLRKDITPIFYYLEDADDEFTIVNNGSETKFSLKKFLEIFKQKKIESLPEDVRELLELIKYDIDCIRKRDYSFLEIEDFFDISDRDFANLGVIDCSFLESEGLWVGTGIRKLEFKFRNNSFLIDKFVLKINKKDNEYLENEICFEGKREKERFLLDFDTDLFLDFFERNNHIFSGFIEVGDGNFLFILPFEIMLIDVSKDLNITQLKDKVSIDFGTSSTCIAKNKGKDLISFTDTPKSLDDYENITAISFFNWEAIYKEWINREKTPYLKRNKANRPEEIDLSRDYFDYGKSVKEQIENIPDIKMIESIVMHLKSIPIKLEKNRENKDSFKPFDNFKKRVFVTDLIDEENEETINPIALYGYIIGRLVNLRLKNRVYPKYVMTFPVTFNNRHKSILKESLEFGLKRSLPKTVLDSFSLELKYEEPVALLGVAKRIKKLSIREKPQKFAVFDFGGGTLDFAFGVYRKPLKNGIVENEDRYNEIVELFRVDGMRLGGEILIERLAYKIYEKHKDIMIQEEIPIAVPEGEEVLKDFPAKLLSNTHIAKVNLKIFSKIARKFFIEGKLDTQENIEVFSFKDSERLTSLKLEEFGDYLDDFIKSNIDDAVLNFYNILEDVFKEYEGRLKELNILDDKIKIILAGNASRCRWIENSFDLKDENHILVKDEEKKITLKNAVAKGALMLNNVYVHYLFRDEDIVPLNFYIWSEEELNDYVEDLTPIFKKGEVSKEWKYIGKLAGRELNLYYSDISLIEDIDDENLKVTNIVFPEQLLNERYYKVFAKVVGDDRIMLVLGDEGNKDESRSIVVNIENGRIENV